MNWFYDIQNQKVKDGEKLKRVVNYHISSKDSNKKIVNNFFGKLDLRDITEKHFKEFMEVRHQKAEKSSIGNNLSFFTTALNHKLKRLAGDTRSKKTDNLKEELKRVITIIKYFRSDYKLTTKHAMSRARAKKQNGHGKITYEQFKNIITWLKDNPEIDDNYVDFYTVLYWQGNRSTEASELKGKNIIVDGNSIKLDIPAILTKDGKGGLYSVHPDIKAILKQRIKENIQPDDYIFTVENLKLKKRQQMTEHYYRKVWRMIRAEFHLRLADGKYMTLHILRHTAVNNIAEATNESVANFTRQRPETVEHYLSDETKNKNELLQLLSWEEKEKDKLKEKANKIKAEKTIKTFFG